MFFGIKSTPRVVKKWKLNKINSKAGNRKTLVVEIYANPDLESGSMILIMRNGLTGFYDEQ